MVVISRPAEAQTRKAKLAGNNGVVATAVDFDRPGILDVPLGIECETCNDAAQCDTHTIQLAGEASRAKRHSQTHHPMHLALA